MRRVILLLVAMPLTLAVSACSGGGGGGQQQAKARPLPESSQDLRAGEYRTKEFKPELCCLREGCDSLSREHPADRRMP